VVNANGKSIGDAGAATIAKALATRPSSTVTMVRRRGCSSVRMPLLGGVRPDSTVNMFFSRFATVLLGRQLALNNNAIGDVGARALAVALAANTTLQELWLRENSIGGAGGAALAKALTVNHTMTWVCAGGSLATGDVVPTISGQSASWRWCAHCLLGLLARACSSLLIITRLATRVRLQWPRCSLSTARCRRWPCNSIRLGPLVHQRWPRRLHPTTRWSGSVVVSVVTASGCGLSVVVGAWCCFAAVVGRQHVWRCRGVCICRGAQCQQHITNAVT